MQTKKLVTLSAVIFLAVGCGVGAITSPDQPQTDAGVKPDSGPGDNPWETPEPPPLPPPKPEECNGYDDDQDGEIDEGCSCTPGAEQECYPGPEMELKGICKLGTMTCAGTSEFGEWGACEGAVTPDTEVCGDGVDQDCDGFDPPCPPECGDAECNGTETCETCPGDCGKCPPKCGDAECNGTEDCLSCPGDCGACPSTCETFTFGLHARPIDIVWIIDQSGSMSTEIAMVKQRMNDFAAYISGTQIDYHVIMLARRGSGTYDICIPPPLGGASCGDGPRFKHVNVKVNSRDGLSKAQANIGAIESFMRPHSMRHFVIVTDDNSNLPAASFDSFLKGRQGYNDYMFHGIFGLQSGGCVAQKGTVYLTLTGMTGGQQHHICNADWNALFQQLGQGVADLAVTQYAIGHDPLPGTMTVTFDNQPTQEGVDWAYDGPNQQIVLQQGHLPPANAQIKVCYDYM